MGRDKLLFIAQRIVRCNLPTCPIQCTHSSTYFKNMISMLRHTMLSMQTQDRVYTLKMAFWDGVLMRCLVLKALLNCIENRRTNMLMNV
jgi:E3 ubiquitin-protein ligase DOA10